ncbi:MAG: HNH endonuclease, partial [Candidatus Accumulibacter sp.]|nr:HNH endonuclease [Accumulibacter sp.]
MEISTVGEWLHWSYANLAMAHSAIAAKAEKYGRTHFMIRSRLYAGFNRPSMNIGPLADDDRLKMVLPQACCYCGSRDFLSVDHLIPRKRGGANTGDNLVWACRSCNSSKGARDAQQWLAEKNQFPPLLLLRRYLKLAIEMTHERELMQVPLAAAPELPFALFSIPRTFPPVNQLHLWVVELPQERASNGRLT